MDAHFARIVEIHALTISGWNAVITASIDRTVKVWNINYIFEPEHHIDRHELPIDSVSVSTDAGIAVVVTRTCIGIWDMLTGKLKSKLAEPHKLVFGIRTHVLMLETTFWSRYTSFWHQYMCTDAENY